MLVAAMHTYLLLTAGAGDCSTSRKACKNCSCGRAEKEAAGEKVTLTQEMLDNPQTNCGNVGGSSHRLFVMYSSLAGDPVSLGVLARCCVHVCCDPGARDVLHPAGSLQ